MINRTAPAGARRWAAPVAGIALLLVALLVPALQVRGASSVEIEARALVGGRYAVGGWLAVSVTLVNEGEPTEGTLAAATESGVMQRFVELPAGARKVVMLYLQPEAFQREVTVEYREANGTVEAVVETRVLEQASSQFATVGDGAGTLRPQLGAADGIGMPAPLSLAASDLPERSEPLEGLSAIAWADDSSGLSEAQRRSLERWVGNGGQLVIVGGPDWQARTAAFTDILPLDGLTAMDGVPQAALASWSGADEAAVDTATVSTGTLRDDARALIRADDGTILASMRPIGAGRVILLGTDLATDAFRGWEGSTRLWARLLPTSATLEQFFGGFPAGEAQHAMATALGNLPSLAVPPAELLLSVIVGYILLIGPISYVVLRRIDRRELAWVTAPLLVVIFSACSFGIGTAMKGSDVIVNQISVIRSSGDGGAATVETYAGIFSPDRATYDLTVEADALVARLRPVEFDGTASGGPDVVVEQGDPAHLRGLAIGVFGFESVRADAIVDREPMLTVTWRNEDGALVGTVTNEGTVTVQDVAYVSSGGGDMIGAELAPGESAEFALDTTNLNGSSASDQVYGFGGFDSTSEAQRRILVRRQVIDALVGFGGFGGLMPGIELAAGTSRGPYVIGWHDEGSPVPVVVDDLEAQRYSQSVEVVSIRPSLLAGPAEIGPAQMAVSVVATEGDATDGGPGTILLGEGSVTYSIALPLEATGMTVDELEILLGPDISMVLTDQGQFGGLWPQGFTLEVRNPITGAWTLLGDISERSSFEIDDPGTAISDTGRIEVRLTGVEQDPNFGQASVFVSARATGVIGE